MDGLLQAGAGLGRAFPFVRGPPAPIVFPGWGAQGTGEDRVLIQLGAVTKKETEASPGIGRWV